MRQHSFEVQHEASWRAFETQLRYFEAQSNWKRAGSPGEAEQLVQGYRMLCSHLSVARSRAYSPALIAELNDLVVRGHNLIYQPPSGFLRQMLGFVMSGFPELVRMQWRYVVIAALVFLLPALLFVMAMLQDDEVVYSLIGPEQLIQMEAMYNPGAEHFARERGSESDFQMFGFYIWNNISIGFQLYATGLLAGIGSLFYLIFNGLYLGAVTAHLTQIGYGETFYSFVIAHGAFELTAIVLCGAAGLQLGHALLQPGRLPRVQALQRAGRESIGIVMGAFLMLVLAAFVEAFWSAKQWPPFWFKYLVGALCWLAVFAYLGLAGRRGSR